MCKMRDHQSGNSEQEDKGLGRIGGITLQGDHTLGGHEREEVPVAASDGSGGHSGWSLGSPSCEPLQVFPESSEKALPAFCIRERGCRFVDMPSS